MNNQEILNNAPEGATHWDGDSYLNMETESYWRETRREWVFLSELILEPDTHLLTDIKRIAELENCLRQYLDTTQPIYSNSGELSTIEWKASCLLEQNK